MSNKATRISDFSQSASDATSASNLDKESFTIIAVKKHDYTGKDGATSDGVLFTTDTKYQIDGVEYDKFYTTRKVPTEQLLAEEAAASINGGTPMGPMKFAKVSGKNGSNYFVLEDA